MVANRMWVSGMPHAFGSKVLLPDCGTLGALGEGFLGGGSWGLRGCGNVAA